MILPGVERGVPRGPASTEVVRGGRSAGGGDDRNQQNGNNKQGDVNSSSRGGLLSLTGNFISRTQSHFQNFVTNLS